MTKKKLPYREGTWFAVPLQSGGYGLGVVARMAGTGPVFGYFFGPKRALIPELGEVANLRAEDAVWLGRFGDLGLRRAEWQIIGHTTDWRRESWPLPPFIRIDPISAGKAVKATYSDTLDVVSEVACDPALATSYPEDTLSGSGAVEYQLTSLLDGSNGVGQFA